MTDSKTILSEVLEVAAQGGDVILEKEILDGIIKEIPILSLVLKAVRISRAVSDYIFYAKIRRFLLATKNVSEEEKTQFFENVNNDPVYAKRVGETLVLILNKIDDMTKAEMLGLVFSYHLAKKINFDTFRRIACAIDSTFTDDLVRFSISGTPVEESSRQRLLHTGFIISNTKTLRSPWENIIDVSWSVTSLGSSFRSAVGENYRA